MSELAIIENSPGLAGYFFKYLEETDYEIFPVWNTSRLPKTNFNYYIFTGDFNNISDGLLPIHKAEIKFLRTIKNKKIFGSCFFHQLIGKIFGGIVKKRETRFFGWQKMFIQREHQIFNGINEPYFLNMNVDELIKKPETALVLATNPDCEFQVLLYGENILTCQSHPELLKQEGMDSINEHRESLSRNCPNLDEILTRTKYHADDKVNNRFMSNIIDWLFS